MSDRHADAVNRDPPAVLVARSLGIPTTEAIRLLENQRARRRGND